MHQRINPFRIHPQLPQQRPHNPILILQQRPQQMQRPNLTVLKLNRQILRRDLTRRKTARPIQMIER